MVGPASSYSSFVIHICWNVLREDRIEPPIHTEYLRSGAAMILIFTVDGASAASSLVMRSAMPGNMVVPPERTMLLQRVPERQHAALSLGLIASLPISCGWKS